MIYDGYLSKSVSIRINVFDEKMFYAVHKLMSGVTRPN